MSAAPTLEIVAGTTYGFDIVWTSDDDGSPIDITGCQARFVIASADGERHLVDLSEIDDAIALGGESGELRIHVSPETTRNQGYRDWAGARYELRVTFPSGDVYSLLRGRAQLIPGVIDD